MVKYQLTMSKNIYLDNAATTPLHPKVLEEMIPYLKENYGNASSIYSLVERVKKAVDTARDSVCESFRFKK